jgi:segregation and condensation protein B
MNNNDEFILDPELELVVEESLSIDSKDDLARVIQALLFASSETVTLKKLKDCIGDFLDIHSVREAIILANDQINQSGLPFEVVEQGGGWRFRTQQRFSPWIKKMFGAENAQRKLSQAALETLSIIAYKQPVTKSEVEQIRGVSSDGPLKSLLERRLVALGGRSENVGNAFQYITTKEFLKYFGINRVPDDLPRLRELEDLIQAGVLIPQISSQEKSLMGIDPNQLEMPIA